MASKFLKKINAKLKFLYCQSKYLSPAYWRLLCNVLIQPLWDYGFSSWFPLLKKKLKLKLQKAQNRCTCFYLTLPLRSHINPSHFRKINWCLYCEYCIVNTGIVLCQDIFMKYLSLHSADIAQDHRWHWKSSVGNKYRTKKLIFLRAKNIVQTRP